MAKNIGGTFVNIEELIDQDEINRVKSEMVTCPDINNTFAGTIADIELNYAKGLLITTTEMIVDDLGLIHSGFIFNAASYVAQAAINNEYSVVIGSKSYFYAPLKLGDILELEAKALFNDNSRKREIKVVGQVKEIKVFEASFQMITTDDHIFNLKRPVQNEAKKNDDDNNVPTASDKTMVEAMKMTAGI